MNIGDLPGRADGSGGPVSARVLSIFEDSGKVPALKTIVPALLKPFLEGAG